MKPEYFKISSGLKNLIGSELITDNYVAVFELVKNSFDANATNVTIRFENVYSTNAKIIIIDNGKGMDYNDLVNKWLFVAYSAKKDGSEETDDYRKKLKQERHYAGAKGVGRFSCDRLGKNLNLISIKKSAGAKIENLVIDWKRFEEDQKKEFITIPVEHNILKSIPYKIKNGTVLEISGINSGEWTRDSLIKLKEKLSKLVRPDLNKSIQEKKFTIVLDVPDEKENDAEEILKLTPKINNAGALYHNVVNGEIKNFIFEELDIRTTKITSRVSDDGKFILTRLVDRDLFLYEIKEQNKFNLLSNVSVTLYFLSQSAKTIFSRRMGIQPVEYGNIFVYKNGFRIYPYGERGDDSLGIDNRAVQGYNRYIGLRNLIGQIDIQGNNTDLREATSRDAGMVKTNAYKQLADTSPFADSILLSALKRLEKYVVEVTQWGINDDNYNINNNTEAKESLVKLLTNIFDDKTLISLDYNKNIIDLLEQKEEKSAKKLLSNFKRVAAENNDPQLLKDAKKLEIRILEQSKAIESATREIFEKEKKGLALSNQLELKQEQLSIATSIASQDLNNVTNLHHQVRVITDVIKTELLLFSRKIEAGIKITNTELKDFIEKISFENSKIESISKFGSRAIFENFTDISKSDIANFIENYVNKISKYFSTTKTKILFTNSIKEPFDIKFRPLDVSIIIDNMISNAKKADASSLSIELTTVSNKSIRMVFKDNGRGLNNGITDPNSIFEKGFSTTKSTGLGLYHIKNIIVENKWEVSVNTNLPVGLEFIITINK